MKNSQYFRQSLSILNPAQKKAVNQIEGPVMVIAGPGTGKTQVLATRIANILDKTDTDPRSILALTFTESAASNMRERLVRMIGKTGYYVQITTFHSFCSEVISSHPEYFEIDRDSEPLSDLERFDFFGSIIEDLNLEKLKPLNAPLFYLRDVMSSISDLKRENIPPEEFEQIVMAEAEKLETEDLKKTARTKLEKKVAKNKELNLIYLEYQKKLRQNLRYDFDDMIALVVEAFSKHEELLLDYQENLLYFLVDEYQDTNSAQNKIVDLLAAHWGDRANIFVVGDPNQSIYRFQGASVENALSFADKYAHAQMITLTTGYRCPQSIYDAAHHLIENNNLTDENFLEPNLSPSRSLILEELNKKLVSFKDKKSQQTTPAISLYKAPSKTLEIIHVAEQINKMISKQKVNPAQIAVLFRNNRDSELIREVFDKWKIAYEIDNGNDVLKTESIRQLLEFFKVIDWVCEDDRELNIFEVMNYEWLGLNTLSVMKVSKIASLLNLSILEFLESDIEKHQEKVKQFELSLDEILPLKDFLLRLRKYKTLDANLTFTTWFEQIINESGYLEFIKNQDDNLELITNLKSLFDEIKKLNRNDHTFKLNSLLMAVEIMQENGLGIQAEDLNVTQNAVHLSTVHKSKGQEWEHVFVLDLVDKKWGNTRTRELIPLPDGVLKNTDLSKKERNEDDRRLFYVGITRARKHVYFSFAETLENNGRTKQQVESMFLSELSPEEQKENSIITDQNEYDPDTQEKMLKLLEPTIIQPTQIKQQQKLFFEKVLKSFKLSSTALNTYLRDPQLFLENNLLRIPRAKALPMAFGTAVHGSLEFWYQAYLDSGKFPSRENLLNKFEFYLQKEILNEGDFKARLKHGREILSVYYESNCTQDFEIMSLEKGFGGNDNRVVLDQDILLSGRIDRIDLLDKNKKMVKVVDYKTGKPKSNNYVEGKLASMELSERERALPESIRGPYKRQLLFYKLLTQLDKRFNFEVSHGSFEFVEPNPSGKIVTRSFELRDKDVEDLKNLIIEVMEEIRELKFLV